MNIDYQEILAETLKDMNEASITSALLLASAERLATAIEFKSTVSGLDITTYEVFAEERLIGLVAHKGDLLGFFETEETSTDEGPAISTNVYKGSNKTEDAVIERFEQIDVDKKVKSLTEDADGTITRQLACEFIVSQYRPDVS